MIFSVISPSGRPAPWTGTACRGTNASDSAKCGKDVFNLTAMKPYETVSLVSAIREPGEQRCVRVYQRPDGTLAATGCPTAPLGAEKPWQFTIRSLLAVIAGFAAFLGLAKWLSPDLPQPTPPPAANSQVIMGDIY